MEENLYEMCYKEKANITQLAQELGIKDISTAEREYAEFVAKCEEWTKTDCKYKGVVGTVVGLEELDDVEPVARFEKGNEVIYELMIYKDNTYIFAKTDQEEKQWQILTNIPYSIIRQVTWANPPRFFSLPQTRNEII